MRLRLLAALFTPLWLANCATIVEGTDQTVTVLTVPEGASCELTRGGGLLGIVNPTPDSINLDKANDSVKVACNKAVYRGGVGVMSSQFQGMTFGNLIFGGIIGVAVDAGSGAMNEYPPAITVSLAPVSFRSIADRDLFYNRRIASVKAEAADAKKQIVNGCNIDSGDDVGCKSA